MRRGLHAPPVRELLDEPQSPAVRFHSLHSRCEPRTTIDNATADASVYGEVEHHRQVLTAGTVDDAVGNQLADHQLNVVEHPGRQPPRQLIGDDAACLCRPVRRGVNLVERACP